MSRFLILISVIALVTGSIEMDCNFACSKNYEPTCGVNAFQELKLFRNSCYLQKTICETEPSKFSDFQQTKLSQMLVFFKDLGQLISVAVLGVP